MKNKKKVKMLIKIKMHFEKKQKWNIVNYFRFQILSYNNVEQYFIVN